ncbi:c-type cytochrome domain-containing protein [Algoriphagus machipongonensis]|uniref:Cytochrome c domain-containing protein n=1 Tax=Algoriphagus machipongonensis TaxID=388413 RepID=A3HTU5_9BACT|nr:c-type cytochrome domain-containing protein [Algoriphagus machipongonensis]EAZ83263.1 hypothetical protein ALPR1_13620 [Algoriphagus machipongonensis]
MLKKSILQQILENTLFVWLGLTFILAIAGNSLVLPEWLQVIGRSHPLLLHFPIVLILMGIFFFWLPGIKSEVKEVGTFSLLIGSNFAGITVIAGLFLAKEGYEGSELSWHQWLGILVFVLSTLLYFFRNNSQSFIKPTSIALGALVIFTGHFGANLTHGNDFLLAPIQSKNPPQVQLAEAQVFRDMVQPIFKAKCQSCHKDGKMKGELRLDILEGIKKGGESGPFITAGDTENSLLFQRIHLPLEHEDHMPPENKEQLTEEEIEILSAWVKGGADFEQKVTQLPKEDNLFILASEKFSNQKNYDFDAADPDLVEELNNFYRKISPLYPDSPALEVSYFGIAAFSPSSLEDLKKISEQVVQINLNKMPLENVDFSFLAGFPNLEELQLNFGDLSDEQIESFPELPSLESLALSGNAITDKVIPRLQEFPNLKYLFVWQTNFSDQGREKLVENLKDVEIDFGFEDDGQIYKLNAPKLIFDNILFQDSMLLEIKHPINTVEIRYTLDGSTPDSVESTLYTNPVWIKNTSKIEARAFANGWLGSDTEKTLLFKSGIQPQNIQLLTQPSKSYRAQGNRTLNDKVKSVSNHTTGEWLGYQDNPLDFSFSFDENEHPSKIVFSLLYHEGAYIFPPSLVEIWVKEGNEWKQIIKENPEQSKDIKLARLEALGYDLPKGDFNEVRVRLSPLTRLPKWHPGAGEKGWVFIDELLLED